MACREEPHPRFIVPGDFFHNLHSVGEPCQRASGSYDIFHLGQVFSLCHAAAAGRPVNIPDLSGMTFHSFHDRLFGENFHQLALLIVFGNGHIAFQGFIRINSGLFAFFP